MGWKLVPRVAALLHLLRLSLRPALAHPTPPPPAIRLLISPLPPSSPPLSDSPTFLRALLLYSLFPRRPASSRLLGAAGEEASTLCPGPARCSGRRISHFSRGIWRGSVCARARVSWRQKLVGSSGEQKVRVFDVPRLLHKPH